MKKLKYHDVQQVTSQPEIIIKEIVREVIKEVPVYQTPQIITKEVIKEVPSPSLIEEINRLTKLLTEKDTAIRQMNFEKTELTSKLNVIEISIKEDTALLDKEIKTLKDENQRLDLGVNKELKNKYALESNKLREENSILRIDNNRSHEENIILKKQVSDLHVDVSQLIKMEELHLHNEEEHYRLVSQRCTEDQIKIEKNTFTNTFNDKMKIADSLKKDAYDCVTIIPSPRDLALNTIPAIVKNNNFNNVDHTFTYDNIIEVDEIQLIGEGDPIITDKESLNTFCGFF